MLMVISPAKTLDFTSPLTTQAYTQPDMLERSQELINIVRQLTPDQLRALMGISDKLTLLNVARFNEWQRPFTPENARQAILAFKGDVYAGLQAETFDEAAFTFAQKHLRILSGLYGVLRPLDLIQPYRLEMGIRLANSAGHDLYHYWGETLTGSFDQTLKEQNENTLLNLASDEYFKAINPKKLKVSIVKPVFLDEKNGQFKVISFYAKRARGLMVRYVIQHRLTQPAQLEAFSEEGYYFDQQNSTLHEPVFKRNQRAE